METPFYIENELWKNAKDNNVSELIKIISDGSQVHFEKKNVDRATFVNKIANMGISSSAIDRLEVQKNDEKKLIDHYDLSIYIKDSYEKKYEGKYAVLTEWEIEKEKSKLAKIDLQRI